MRNNKDTVSDLRCLMLIIILLIVMIGSAFLRGYIEEKEVYIEENTSTAGIIVDKSYSSGYRGYHFFITIERQSVNIKGEEISKEDTLVVDYEEWVEIEIGDIATYNDDGSVTFDHPSGEAGE